MISQFRLLDRCISPFFFIGFVYIGVGSVLLAECSLQQPADDREVATLVVGREDDGVLVLFGGHFGEGLGLEIN